MNKSEIITFGSLSLVAVLLWLTIRDLVGSDSIAINALVGTGAGLFAFWWAFGFLPRFKTTPQFFFTLSLVASILFVAFVFNSEGRSKKSEGVVHMSQMRGSWVTRADGIELILQISDSLTVLLDKNAQKFGYKITEDELTVFDRENKVVYDWTIISLDSKTMVLDDYENSLEFTRMTDSEE